MDWKFIVTWTVIAATFLLAPVYSVVAWRLWGVEYTVSRAMADSSHRYPDVKWFVGCFLLFLWLHFFWTD